VFCYRSSGSIYNSSFKIINFQLNLIINTYCYNHIAIPLRFGLLLFTGFGLHGTAEFFQQFPLAFVQGLRNNHFQVDQLVAAAATPQMSNTLALKPEDSPVLAAGRDLEFSCTIDGRYFQFATQRGLDKVYREFIKQVIFFPEEKLVFADSDIDINIAVGAAA